MRPGEQHRGAVAGQELLVYQKAITRRREHLFQRPEDDLLGQRVEAPWGSKSPSATSAWRGGWKSSKYSPKCVNHHDSGGDRFGEPDRGPEILGQALVSDPAEVLEQCPVKLEVGPEHLGQRQDPVAMGLDGAEPPRRSGIRSYRGA